MPELPEVETIRRGLEKTIVGKTIQDVEVRLNKMLAGDKVQVIGARVEAIRRFGKGLVIDLSNGFSITAHVKMTGQFIYLGKTQNNFHPKLTLPLELPSKHTHVIFRLKADGGEESTLFYNDIRQFGWLKVVKTLDVHDQPFFKSLGPEPFSDLTLPIFVKIVSSSSMPIKPLLMDQTKISGVGNIYANDALYASAIDPRRKSNSLTQEEGERLFVAVLEVLERGIAHGGASEINYVNVEGGKGSYQDHFLVYGKNGETCIRCSYIIERIKQGGRSTFYCPGCQK
ncbi:DNA-formamidopyrimidine glycosylase [soil metagenome]